MTRWGIKGVPIALTYHFTGLHHIHKHESNVETLDFYNYSIVNLHKNTKI